MDSYSCIPDRGTLKGAQRSGEFARKITRNYTQKAYFLKADIGNFFNSIDKEILFRLISKQVSEPWLLRLIEKVLFHDPKNNVFMKSPPWLYKILPKYKSLFNADPKKGLPIGNLTSQFFSNIYMNPLDQFVKHKLKCKYYCRYVDDMLLLDKDPAYLNWAYSQINKFLNENLALSLNHKKKNMNLVSKGFDFVGHVIKPNHMHIRTKTIKNAFCAIKKWENNPNKFSQNELKSFRNKINSYLGMLRHVNGYNLRKKICLRCTNLFMHCDENYTKMILTDYGEDNA